MQTNGQWLRSLDDYDFAETIDRLRNKREEYEETYFCTFLRKWLSKNHTPNKIKITGTFRTEEDDDKLYIVYEYKGYRITCSIELTPDIFYAMVSGTQDETELEIKRIEPFVDRMIENTPNIAKAKEITQYLFRLQSETEEKTEIDKEAIEKFSERFGETWKEDLRNDIRKYKQKYNIVLSRDYITLYPDLLLGFKTKIE